MGANPNFGRLARPGRADADKAVGPELGQIISHYREQNQHRERAQPEHVQFPAQRGGINQQRHRDHETTDGQAKNFKNIPQASQCFRAVAFQTRIELVDETEQKDQPDIRERYEQQPPLFVGPAIGFSVQPPMNGNARRKFIPQRNEDQKGDGEQD